MRSADWDAELQFGLPEGFNFRVIRTVDDVQTLMAKLPNEYRGLEAKSIYKKRNVLGKQIAYSALMTAWDHDHEVVRDAFGDDRTFVRALRQVSGPSKRKRSVRVWRGVSRLEGALGAAWTMDRDLACWFAMRYFERDQTAFLFTCLLPPDQIVTEYNGRSEHEVIPDLRGLAVRLFLDAGNGNSRIKFSEIHGQGDVPRSALAEWRKGFNRTRARRQAERRARLRRVHSRSRRKAIRGAAT